MDIENTNINETFNRYDWTECSKFDEKGNSKDEFDSIYGEYTSPRITGCIAMNFILTIDPNILWVKFILIK